MRFRAGALVFNATVADASEAPSPQTGEPLRSLTIQFRAQKADMHEQALEQAQQRQTGGLFSIDESDAAELEWRVRESTSQYVGSEPWGINHHVWLIEQVERLACERLIIGSLQLEPYEYAEAVDDEGAVRLAARALISEDGLQGLARLADLPALDVVRIGISDKPRRMTMSYVWGDRPEAPAVVVRCEDVREPRVTLDTVTGSHDALVAVVEVLTARGLLGEAELDELRRRRHEARRVTNPDAWRLSI